MKHKTSPAEFETVEGTFGRMQRIEDFLPRPEDLIYRSKSVKVTIALSEDSVAYFKRQADRHDTSYQRMIRNLLDAYVRQMETGEETDTVQPR